MTDQRLERGAIGRGVRAIERFRSAAPLPTAGFVADAIHQGLSNVAVKRSFVPGLECMDVLNDAGERDLNEVVCVE